jgi:glycosyltransferase involved in cell wall biosynthesis
MVNKKLSIIIPTYNIEKYIDECIESLREQLTPECELILIDDCSSDSTVKRISECLLNTEYYLYQHLYNYGVSAARNDGIVKSTGEYIVFIDGDDFVTHNYIKEILNAITSGMDYYTVSWDSLSGSLRGRADRLRNPAVWCRVYKRGIIKHFFDETISIAEDTKFIKQNITRDLSHGVIMESIYRYRDNRVGSLTYNNANKEVDKNSGQ